MISFEQKFSRCIETIIKALLLAVMCVYTCESFGNSFLELSSKAKQSLDEKNWDAASRYYEQLVAEGYQSSGILQNLAIARLELRQPAEALVALLAAKSQNPSDQQINTALEYALKQMGLDLDTLDLSSHGLLIAWLAKRGWSQLQYTVIVALVLSVITLFLLLFRTMWSQWQAILTQLGIVLVVCVAILWTFIGIWYVNRGNWAVVVKEQGDVIRAAPSSDASEVTRTMQGLPVFATGNTYAAWVKVWTAEGKQGWMDALSLRMIRPN